MICRTTLMMSDKANLLDIDSMMDVVAMYKCKFCDHTMESSAAMKNHISEHLLPARNLSYSQVDFYPMHIVKSKSIRFYPFSNIWEGMECTVQCCFFLYVFVYCFTAWERESSANFWEYQLRYSSYRRARCKYLW